MCAAAALGLIYFSAWRKATLCASCERLIIKIARGLSGMASINDDIEFPFTSKFETQSIKVFCKYIIRNVVLALVYAFLVGDRCINGHKTLIPSIIFIAIFRLTRKTLCLPKDH